MTENEVDAVRAELESISNTLSNALYQILQQEVEIRALHAIVERQEISEEELDAARESAGRQLRELLPWARAVPAVTIRSRPLKAGRGRCTHLRSSSVGD